MKYLRLFRPGERTEYVRSFIFGVEDGLVSTVGLLSGIAVADAPRQTIILTGFVLVSVEAFSMGMGSYLSERSTIRSDADFWRREGIPIKSGIIMFVSYFIAGLIPLSPYLFSTGALTFWLSIAFTLLALLALGAGGAKLMKNEIWSSSLRMALLAGVAILIGVGVGKLFK